MGFLDERANLEGKHALVMGGGGGLGRAAVLDLARAGVQVSFCDRDETALRATEQEATTLGGVPVAVPLDVRDADAVKAFLDHVDDARGASKVHILVNVVGGTFRSQFAESVPNGWDAIIRANFTWLLHTTHAVIPRLRAAGGGSIINVTSIEGHRAAPGFAVYSGMKAAVTNYSRTLALELAPEGIRVNTIAPDNIPTDNLEVMTPTRGGSSDNDHQVHQILDQISRPLGRLGTLEDFGNTVLYLASDLSSYMTGVSLHPDGGVTASAGWLNWPTDGYLNGAPKWVAESILDHGGGE
jgi:3-oxoacyl-[acyl-carrier protein] reductase